MTEQTESLLRALLVTVGRSAFPLDQLYEIVDPTGKGGKQVQAFNLADGTRTQADIRAITKLDSGNLSRTVSRWLEAGIIFRVGEDRDAKLLHIYPIPSKRPKTRD